jgi:hypothetical protein
LARIDTCAFCSKTGDDFDPEHWVPQWLSKELIPKHAAGVINFDAKGRSWKSSLFDLTVPHVCTDCNRHWMSDIETQAKKHVLPAILGDYSKPITKDWILHIMRWSYFKVITLELGRPSEHIPTHSFEVYEQFRQTKLPPFPNCSLAVGARERITDPTPDFVTFASQAFNAPGGPAGEQLHFHQTTLFVGHLIIDLFGLAAPYHVDAHHTDGLQVLWPAVIKGGQFTWPPHKRLASIADVQPLAPAQ